jgi:topoisomerase-4 subunit B
VAGKTWSYPDGLAGYLAELAGAAEAVAPLYAAEKYADADHADFAPGEGASWALGWHVDAVASESYVNLIPTVAGGTHESGLRAGVFEAVKSFIEHRALLPRGVKLQQDDVCGRMAFVLSARILDPQFQGQVKEKLNSREAVKLVSSMVRDPSRSGSISMSRPARPSPSCPSSRRWRARRTRRRSKRKSSPASPCCRASLSDCESTDIAENELFLVEGDSAGGSAKMARNKETQAILPLRGKVLNSWEVEAGRLFANNEIHDIAVALGSTRMPPTQNPTSAICAMARSSSCPTPTSMAHISRPCC